MRLEFIIFSCICVVFTSVLGFLWQPFFWLLLPLGAIIAVGIYDMIQTRHTIWRNFPILGRGRQLIEILRPPFQQYFVESDIDGTPVNRMFRSIVYRRAKRVMDSNPFGTKVDVYRTGYEWMDHSLAAIPEEEMDADLRVVVGGPDCTKPYSASILNISAMSFGALSTNAILALNGAAKRGGFAHNTGEGGLSPYHLRNGGDIIWQIGTGYFGCRTNDGRFSEELFQQKAVLDAVKMIELKLSQGAKPGHGGILPADKNSEEIAAIRGVEPYTQVNSPAVHSAFQNPLEMMYFIKKLRDLSGGKPVGFKLCVGRKSEMVSLCMAMVKTGITPDFITVDGGEGGTGAAPLEYSNSVGMPLRDAVAFVVDCLMGFNLKDKVKVAASGKMFTGFHLVKNLALGADWCNSARGMMLALGCIQALECNSNRCPTGITTQNPRLVKGLVVNDKIPRVVGFHELTVKSVRDLLSAAGLESLKKLNRSHINRRINAVTARRYDEIFPYLPQGTLLEPPYPLRFNHLMTEASTHCFSAERCIVNFEDEMREVEE
ncbi:FMN-binding glutamate synthase family protein [Desulfosediminicola flagellatus]|uniref:FMN-binding glutamate synthase family protein n=1 Tax=Desulfosediminicola flagellatus TaxID=2569541 RepID=UPI0010ABC655|nr:FMN-binding glutamate synthase family protein [Desulfosediminicola flagellatus]